MEGGVWRWNPSHGSSLDVDFNPRKVSFDDGYAQRIKRPRSGQKRSFQLRFDDRPASVVADMIAFLDALGGSESFEFFERDQGIPIRVVCEHYSVVYSGNTMSGLTAEFAVVHEFP